MFDENSYLEWDQKYEKAIRCDLDWNVHENGTKNPSLEEVEGDPEFDVDEREEYSLDSLSGYATSISNKVRNKRQRCWMEDYVSREGLFLEENEALLVMSTTDDPIQKAIKSEKWRKTMDVEMEAIKRNNTWELAELPKGAKKVGVKWVYKTKLNENGEVDKYKARLVVKGYAQEYGVDYTEVFAPIARVETIRLVVAFAAHQGWPIYQLDVKSAFLYGELS